MRAHQPWSGNYEVSAPIWMTAHWTQFTQPGWRFLHVPGGGSGLLRYGPSGSLLAGSYVTLVPPAGGGAGEMTLIVETLDNDSCTPRNMTDVDLTVQLVPGTGLPPPGTPLQVWVTTSSSYFQRQADVAVGADGSFSLRVPADAIITVSTTQGAVHGTFPTSPIPAAAPFPLPYSDDFGATYAYDALAKYFSDQGGSWAVRNGSLVQVAIDDPGPNQWLAGPEPLTQIGDEAWQDYAVSATARFSTDPVTAAATAAVAVGAQLAGAPLRRTAAAQGGPRRRRGAERVRQWRRGHQLPPAAAESGVDGGRLLRDSPVMTAPCDDTDAAQAWAWNISSAGYLSSVLSHGNSCLNVGGCDPTSIIMYQCLTDPGGSSCGAPAGDYPNLQWSLAASGALTTHMSGGMALTLVNGSVLQLAPFTGAPAQVWAFNASSGQVALPALGRCLSLPPRRKYVQVCGRVTSFNGFDSTQPMAGYCVVVDHAGAWALTAGGSPLANGTLAAGFSPSSPHTLALSMAGPIITASVDGTQLAQLSDGAFTYGNAALGAGWHRAAWDGFNVTAPTF